MSDKLMDIANRIAAQADCLIHYAEQSGEKASPLPSVYHLQAGHFRGLAHELRDAVTASTLPDMAEVREVTRDDAISWMENAMRNWRHVPRLSRDDVEEVRVALQRFAEKAVKEALLAKIEEPR